MEECQYWWNGAVLKGKYSHYCAEWDDLPIDETCEEFMCCSCFEETPEIFSIQEKMRKEIFEDERTTDSSSGGEVPQSL